MDSSGTVLIQSARYRNGQMNQMLELQRREKFCDIHLVSAEGHIIPAHAVVLHSSSDYFREKINNLESDEQGSFSIDCQSIPHKILCYLLEFIYVGEVKLPKSAIVNLLTAAENVQLHDLNILCRHILRESNEENCFKFKDERSTEEGSVEATKTATGEEREQLERQDKASQEKGKTGNLTATDHRKPHKDISSRTLSHSMTEQQCFKSYLEIPGETENSTTGIKQLVAYCEQTDDEECKEQDETDNCVDDDAQEQIEFMYDLDDIKVPVPNNCNSKRFDSLPRGADPSLFKADTIVTPNQAKAGTSKGDSVISKSTQQKGRSMSLCNTESSPHTSDVLPKESVTTSSTSKTHHVMEYPESQPPSVSVPVIPHPSQSMWHDGASTRPLLKTNSDTHKPTTSHEEIPTAQVSALINKMPSTAQNRKSQSVCRRKTTKEMVDVLTRDVVCQHDKMSGLDRKFMSHVHLFHEHSLRLSQLEEVVSNSNNTCWPHSRNVQEIPHQRSQHKITQQQMGHQINEYRKSEEWEISTLKCEFDHKIKTLEDKITHSEEKNKEYFERQQIENGKTFRSVFKVLSELSLENDDKDRKLQELSSQMQIILAKLDAQK